MRRASLATLCLFALASLPAGRAEADTPVLTFEGLAPVRIGMTVAQLRQAAGPLKPDRAPAGEAGCWYTQAVKAPAGTKIMIESGVVTRIDAPRGVRTFNGIGIGDPESKVLEALAVFRAPNKYDPDGEDLIAFGWKPAERGNAFLFGTSKSDSGKSEIGELRVGKIPSVLYVEGCL